MNVLRDRRNAALSIAAATALSLAGLSLMTATSAQAAGRSQNQDHRHPNIGGQAVPGGPHIKCVVPFCGNSFNPQGRRPQSQDHRPGSNVPPIVNRPRQVSNSATNAACLANHTCVPNTQWSPPQGGGHGRPRPQPQRPPIVPSP